ncbi:MAG: heme NO-binding domain-containing protein [Gemmatimonas sp.]
MYGMINQAVRKLVVDNHGETTWQRICTEAGIGDADFNTLEKYPDDITYRLVGAASKVLGAPAEAILETFGEYWTEYAKQTSFSRLMQFGGRTFEEFVANLDQMHAKIKFSLPELEPPMFRISDSTPGEFRLHYHSKRAGLAPLVKGMMRGLGKTFGVLVEMTLARSRADGHDHDEFLVRYAPAPRLAE